MREVVNMYLTRRYLIALGFIAFLSCSAFIVTRNLISIQETNAAVINISGRQRMLSQKAVLLSCELVHSTNTASQQETQVQLLETANLIEKSHDSLINGNTAMNLPGSTSPEIRSIYFSEPYLLDQRVKNFTKALRALAKVHPSPGSEQHLQYILNEGKTNLLTAFDTAVSQYQKESEEEIAELKKVETAIVVLTLMVLVIEGLFVFRPMVKRIWSDRQELSDANERLLRISSLDGLTGIPNRRSFDEFFQREWHRALRSNKPLSVIMADIDFFKAYNDTYGHQQGDGCLKQIAAVLNECANRPGDLVARYGGEEFVAVLGDTDINGAVKVAERMRSEVELLKIIHQGSKISGFVTISLGVGVITPTKDLLPEALISMADQALYQAKNEGRNRVKSIKTDNKEEEF